MTHRALITAGVAACVLLALFPAGGRAQAVLAAPGTVTLGGSSTSLTVDWTAPASDGGSAITAYDLRYTADDNSMVEEDIWSSGALQYELTGLQRDTSYKVEVRAVNANGDGPWSDPTSGATTDHGDSRSSASLIALDSSLSGRIDESDTDWFSFTVTGTEDIWIYSASDAPTDLVGELFDAVGDPITRSSNSYRFENTLDFSLRSRLGAGTYYVQVTSGTAPGATHTGPYVLHARRGVTPGASFDTAATIETGVSVAAYLVDQQDEHFFTFTVERATDVWLLSEGSVDTAAVLRDSNRLRLADNDDGFLDGIERGFLISATLQPGEYYLSVTSYHMRYTGAYVLRFLTGDNPGNTPQTAATVPFYGIATGNIASSSDRDYFRLTMDAPTGVRLRVLARGLRSINLAVFDEDGIDVSGDFRSTRDPVQVVGFMNTGTYSVRITSGDSGRHRYLLRVETSDDQHLLDECAAFTHTYADPLYGCQWHLSNTGQFDGADQDINVEAAWGTTLGSGVNVAVVDEAMRTTHPDLRDNIVTARNHNFFSPPHADDEEEELFHATAVAGLIGARDNGRGVRGVAPRASLHSIDLIGGFTSDFQEGQAMALHLRETHISNNSWGPLDTGVPEPTHSAWFSAIERGVRTGAGGKGISYVWAAGNGGRRGDDANLDEYATHYGVTAVCAVNIDDTRSAFSETGANLWVCAPSDNESVQRGLMTTAPFGYEPDFGGTSGAAPVVSGVIALMRAANPELTWRDVKLILAATARKNDSTNSGWEDGALQYGSSTERYSFNHEYGFGVVDAGAAVARALTWPDTDTLPAFREITGSSTAAPLLIPDLPDGGTSTTITSTLEVDNYVEFVEFLEINIDLAHTSMRDLDIDLVSPSGVTSRLARKGQGYVFFFFFYIPSSSPIDGNHRFGSARHLGENAAGTWTLRVTDRSTGNSGTLKSWSVTAYGHGHTPDPPVIQNGTSAATSVTVVWTAPTDIGGSAVTSYDLRYIRADAADKSGLNWTPVNAIWTSGELSYELTGLDRGRSYDLQMRAVNASGAGPWSPPMTGATLALAPESPAIESIQPRNGKLIVEWSMPGFDGGAPISSYDVRHVLSENLSDPDPPWTILSGVGARIAPGEYRYTVGGLENDASHAVQVRAANRAGAGEWSNAATGTPDAENTNPAFLEGETAPRSLREDVAAGTDVGAALLAVDADSDPLEYTVSGEIGPFSFDPATAQLRVAEALDYETATTYTIGVQVQDGQDDSGNSDTAVDDTIEVTITVEDLDEGFEISGVAFITREENTTGVLETYTATDPEGKDLTWSRGGTDGDDFTLADGALSFAMTPDYEAPLDSDGDGDNVYSLDVSASDGVNVTTVAVTVAVVDINELPIVTGPSEPTIEENSDGEIATYTATDPEGRLLTWDVLQYSHHGPDYGEFDLVFDHRSDEGARLRLQRVPDFESPTDADRDNVYEVTLYSNDREGAFWQWKRFDVQVTVTNVNEQPVVSGPTALTRRENGDVFLGAYEARDPDAGDTASWDDLEGDDADHFRLDASGRLSFRTPPDFEARANADEDNVYEVIVVASDGMGLQGRRQVIVTVTDANDPPVVHGPAAVPKAENSDVVVASYSASDPDAGDTATWQALEGLDDGLFELDAAGVLRFKASPDYEAPGDRDENNVYNVTLVADDGMGLRGRRQVAVTVTNVNEPPEVTGPARASVDEGHTGEVARYATRDAEGATNWGRRGETNALRGTDADLFTFAKTTGALSFVTPPDYEERTGYEVTVSANDGASNGELAVTVTVNNLEEKGSVTFDGRRPILNEMITATLEDGDGVAGAVGWTWERSPTGGGSWTEITEVSGSTSNTYLVVPGDRDHYLRATATYSDALGPDKTAQAVTELRGANIPTSNTHPVLPDSVPDITIPENTPAGRAVGSPVTATDADLDPLHYTLQGSDDFGINNITGQLRVTDGVVLDHETRPRYTLTVGVDDGFEGRDSVTVTVTVTDVNEAPEAADLAVTVAEDGTVDIDVVREASDEDAGDTLTVESVVRDPQAGTVAVDGVTNTITYTPQANYVGSDNFTYRVKDEAGLPSNSATVTITVTGVNDAPAFAAAPPPERSVSENAQPEANVGAPVTATDVDDDTLTYRLAGSADFEIDEYTGQITVAEGAALDAALSPYSVTVTADDGTGEANATAMVDVTITVTAGPPVITVFPGGGGGGGGGGGPTPSELDFEWNVTRDIEELDAANDRATGVWSDGTTLWLADNADGAGDAVYAYDRESGERVESREFALAETNRAPRGFWSDRSVVWVSDSGQERLFAYRLADGERLDEREIALAERNSDARGIWSDEETMWVIDDRNDALFAYDLDNGEVIAEYGLDSANDTPHGIWSDRVTVWVSDHGAKRLFAYRLSTPEGPAAEDAEPQDLERVRDEEFPSSVLSRASNNSPRGIWSDGDVMYVADESDDKVYSYNMPDAIDARLASLTLSGVDIGEFSPGRTDYEAVVADGVTETTVEAEAMQRRTAVAIDPPDADGDDANGHQVALRDIDEITVTVISQDGSRTRVYRVQFPETGWDPARDPWPHCLRGAVSEGLSLVVYEGGSVEELVGCAESRGVAALYALHEGVYLAYILGAPGFVNRGFVATFAGGVPPVAPLVVRSDGPPSPDPFGDDLEGDGQQPWPECLRGPVAAGLSLVVYEGGSVDELEACARSREITALYALHEGVYLAYILGAPAFVNQSFHGVFAGGLPFMTPLVARSEGPPGGS